MKKILIVFFKFVFLNCLNNQLNESNSNITITVSRRADWRAVGKIGNVVLSIGYSEPEIYDDINIEEKTKFEAGIEDTYDNENKYKIYCR